MHPPSQRNRRIGFAGLAWFLFCTFTSIVVLADPDGFRRWATEFTWSDRELLIGAICYFIAGLGGLVLVITRLILPLFYREQRLSYAHASPLLVIDVSPSFEDFHTLAALNAAQVVRTKIIVMLLSSVILFVMLEHPELRHHGISFEVALKMFGWVLVARATFLLMKAIACRTRLWSSLRWMLVPRHRQPRRYHIFEDGLLVQGSAFAKTIPWYDVKQVQLFGNTIGIVGRGELMVIPGDAVPSQEAADGLMAVLQRKSLLVNPNPLAPASQRPVAALAKPS